MARKEEGVGVTTPGSACFYQRRPRFVCESSDESGAGHSIFIRVAVGRGVCGYSFVTIINICQATRARANSIRIRKLEGKIGHYMKMAMQTAEATSVRLLPRWEPVAFEEVEDSLPKDPRQWTRDHVAQWINLVTQQHGLPEVPSSRFLMNGKALCLMTPGMFLMRVPLGGKLLYKDFQLRLCTALYGIN